MVIEQGWLKPRLRSDYDKYLTGGNFHLLTEDFKGKARCALGYYRICPSGRNMDKSHIGGDVPVSIGSLLEHESTKGASDPARDQ